MKTKLLFLLTSMFFCFQANSQTFDFSNSKFSEGLNLDSILITNTPDTIRASHEKWNFMCNNPSLWGSQMKFKSLNNMVTFYIDYNNKKIVNNSYSYLIPFHLRGYSNPNQPTSAVDIYDTLSISYDKDSLKAFQDKFTKKYSDFHKIEIIIDDIYKTDGINPPILLTTANAEGFNCRVEGEVWVQFYNKNYYGFTASSMPELTVMQDASSINTNRELGVSWKCATCTENIRPSMYELEWTYIDDYKYSMASQTATNIPIADINYSFKNNATRIITKDTFFKIPIVYDKGYIVYRTRMVRPDSVNYIQPIYGQWSIVESGTLSSLSSNHYYYNSQAFMGDSLNWQYGISFAEDGKYKHVVSYYDGLLHNKQSTTKINSDTNYIIVSKTIDDFEGRPTIQLLPIPVIEKKVDYVKNFAINSQTNNYYRASDFDSIKGGLVCTPPVLDSLSTSSRAYTYYSPLNTLQDKFNQYIPNANGYPLVQTIVSPENPKKVFSQGGAGKQLQIDKGHATKYAYAGTFQNELNRLFGSEIGKNEYYQKTIVDDPNGQSSLQVNNNSGKVVYSAMLGRGPNALIHPIDTMDLAPNVSYTLNVIDNVPQTTTAYSKSLNTAFFSDVEGNNTVQYSNTFTPFNTGCPNKFLSVKSKYYYEILDDCFHIIDSTSGVLGINGVLPNNTPITYMGGIDTPYFKKANYIVNKTLSFNPDDVVVAVDSFMKNAGNCYLDENYFIKQEIQAKIFPCPQDTTSPCDQLKQVMLGELYPNHKYGSYSTKPNGLFDHTELANQQNLNSIFTGYGFCDGCIPTYRYQDPCITLPDTITKNGIKYFPVKTLSQDIFIDIFNDTIAEALLSLHPEYCKLKGCFLQNDRYSDTLSNITDTAEALSVNKLQLNQIALQDPLYLKNIMPNIFDSLIHFTGTNNRIDTFALAQSYGGGLTPQIISTSLSSIYNNVISSTTPFSLASSEPIVYDLYYNMMSEIYVSNRESIKAKLMGTTSNNCQPCDSMRMTLIPSSVFPDMSLTQGGAGASSTLDSLNQAIMNDTTLSNMNGSGIPSWMATSLASGNMNATTLDSINATANADNFQLCEASVDGILSKFRNCTLINTKIQEIRDSLMQIFCVHQETFSVARMSLLLSNLGLTQSDICNPYVLQINTIPSMDFTSENLLCKSQDFYDNAKQFFNNIKPSFLSTGASNTILINYTLTATNSFEGKILTGLGLSSNTNIAISNTYYPLEHQYKMEIYQSATPNTKVTFWINNTNNSSTAIPFSSFTSFDFTDAVCLTEFSSAVLPTHINLYTIALKATGIVSGATKDVTYLAYNQHFKTLEINSSENKLSSDASACIEVSRWFNEAKTELDNLGIYYNHQNYEMALLNIINAKTNKLYTFEDISDFVKSCALTDSLKQKTTTANWQLTCADSSQADILLSSIAGYLNYVPDYIRYRLSNGNEVILLKYNNMTDDTTYLAFNDFINAIPSSTVTSKIYNRTFGNDTLAILFVPKYTHFDSILNVNLFADLSDITIANSTTTLGNANNFYNGLMTMNAYNLYTIKINNYSTLPAYKIARYVDSLSNVLYNQSYGTRLLSNYAGLMNEDYYLIEKQQWLHHNNTTNTVRHDSVLQRLSIDSLYASMPSLSGQHINYGDPVNNEKADALFINQISSYINNVGYRRLKLIFDMIGNQLNIMNAGYPTSNAFAFNEDSIVITMMPSWSYPLMNWGANSSLKVFKCGSYKSGTYMIRYFDNNNQLFTAYYETPTTLIGRKMLKRDATKPLLIGPGDGQTYRFSFEAYKSVASSYKYNITGYTDFDLGNTLLLQNSLLKPSAFNDYTPIDTTSCERDLIDLSIVEGKVKYQEYIDSIRTAIINNFSAYMVNAVTEKLDIGIKDLKYYFTLYYYDRAGNLTRTVPPAGASSFNMADATKMTAINNDRTNSVTNNINTISEHKKVSTYKYNSVNELYEQNTPDGGKTLFWYDAVGRMVFSQNAKQFANSNYSYTLYDDLGRISEVGQIHPSTNLNPIFNSHTFDQSILTAYIKGLNRTEVCATLYDEEGIDLQNVIGMSAQDNLRKRVSASKYFNNISATIFADTSKNYAFATYYSYDILGNVKTITHDYKEILEGKQRFKRIDYDYDLYSGKVNMVSYNRGFADQFYQKYSYDKDNRITVAETSKDGIYWDRDAEYEYYAHGPLARMKIGDQNVQGVDYAYTIQGWLKAINGDVLDTLVDMGKDGIQNSAYLKDVFAMTLNYFGTDYESISGKKVSVLAEPNKGLYNGNIARQNVALQPFDNLNKNYRYDPLNRIMSTAYNKVQVSGTVYNTVPTTAFAENFTYDLDGNIMKLLRKGNDIGGGVVKTMDSLEYFYNANGVNTVATAKNAVNNNKLNNVFDYANHNNSYSNDIAQFPTTAVSNSTVVTERYKYDEIGNLISDEMNGISAINWNLYGKVSKINMPLNANDVFTYDATGNRISKTYSFYNTAQDTLTQMRDIYVRDAQGNILAIYNDERASVITTVKKHWWDKYVDWGYTKGFHNFHNNLISLYSLDQEFANGIITQASKSPATFNDLFAQTTFKTYCKLNPSLFKQTIDYTPQFMSMLKVQQPIVFDTIVAQVDNEELAKNICNVLEENVNDRFISAMNSLRDININAFEFLLRNMELPFSGDTVKDNATLIGMSYEKRTIEMKDVLVTMFDGTSNEVFENFKHNYVSALIDNESFYVADTSYYYPMTHSLFVENVYQYYLANRDEYHLFLYGISSEEDTLKAMMKEVCNKEDLMGVNYAINSTEIINVLCEKEGASDVMNGALAKKGHFSLDDFLHDLEPYHYPWWEMQSTTTLFKRHFHLAEHHLYGSSRLGIKKYLPNHYEYSWKSGEDNNISIDSAGVSFQQAWYNSKINDFVKYANTDYVGANNLDHSNWLSHRIIGMKNYELTNHLGNVQATVLDKFTPRTQNLTDTLYNKWFANVNTATDYYAFGSPMPSRTTQDTVTQTLTAVTPFASAMVYVLANSVSDYNYFAWNTYGGMSQINSSSANSLTFSLGCPNNPVSYLYPYGVRLKINNLVAGKNYKLYAKVSSTYAQTKMREIKAMNPPLVLNSVSQTATTQVLYLPFVATLSGTNYVDFVTQSQCDYVTIDSIALVIDSSIMTYVTTTLTDRNLKDRYRFGSNAGEKDNEIAGMGNMYTAKFWEYNAQLGLRWNRDPVLNPSVSPYSVFGCNPIANNDINGDKPSKPDKQGKSEGEKKVTTETVSTPGGQPGCADCFDRINTETWYWHNGSKDYGTKAGWYKSEEYKNVLQPIARDLAGYSGLYVMLKHELNWSESEKENLAHTFLGNFYSKGMSNITTSILANSALELAKKANFSVTGTIYYSNFNIEDMIGVGLVFKNLAKMALVINTTNEIEKVSGAYFLEFQSGRVYVGKGLEKRMEKSILRLETENADKLLKKTFYPAASHKEAFIKEYQLMLETGHKPLHWDPNSILYNKIWSPGKKLSGH